MTEAINANAPTEPLFSLIDPDAPLAVRDHLTNFNKVVGPGRIALLPFISTSGKFSHITLLILHISNGFQADHFDSSPKRRQRFTPQGNKDLEQTVESVVRAGWYPQPARLRHFNVTNQTELADRALAHREWCCGVHVILNGWAYALGLSLNTQPTLNDDFYREAVQLIDHVMRGSVSSGVIVAFLECYRFIVVGQTVEAGRRFESSVGLAGRRALGERVRERIEGAEMEAAVAASLAAPGTGTRATGRTSADGDPELQEAIERSRRER